MEDTSKFTAVSCNGIRLLIPDSIFRIFGLFQNERNLIYEPYIFGGLKSCLRSGNVVYDIGSSYGILTSLISKWIGKKGVVFSFESENSRNLIQNMLKINGLENNVKFVDCVTLDFDIGKFSKDNKLPPDCINLELNDQGRFNVTAYDELFESSPDMILKIPISFLSGDNEFIKFLNNLQEEDYLIFDLKNGNLIKNILSNQNPENISYFLVSKKLADQDFLKHLRENIIPEIRQSKSGKKIEFDINEVRQLMNTQNYTEVIAKLSQVSPYRYDAEIQYYLALSLQMTNQNYEEALLLYDAALGDGGFEPFWIYYNRSALYNKMGQLQNAIRDLKRAYDLNPNHEGLLTMMKDLNMAINSSSEPKNLQ